MNRYAIFLDIDGTLLCGRNMHPKNCEVIKRVREEGHLVFINTGRSYGYIPEAVTKDNEYDGYVTSIGACVRAGDLILKQDLIDRDEVKKLTEYYLENKIWAKLECEEGVLYINDPKYHEGHTISEAYELDTTFKSYHPSKIFVSGIIDDKIKEELENKFMVYQHQDYYEFSGKGSSKASGMNLMLDYFKIHKERSLALGDSLNDKDMLEEAGISIAMGNASEDIKSICDYVSCSTGDGGVGYGIAHYLLKEN
ncbi:MAG: HAD-IIB family hydrolase [Bacillota bacterium]|nr:HAD-IIB family hydrolase [Bacillota bacterium]